MDVKIFTDNIEGQALNQVYTLAKLDAFKDSKIRIMPDCLPDYTEILTTDGFKFLKDLKCDDLVANYDDNTGEVFFEKPLEIISRPLKPNENIYNFISDRTKFTISATENHRMLTKDGVKLAKDIDDITVLSDYIYSGKGLKISQTINKYSDIDIQLITWVVGDGNIHNNLNSKTQNGSDIFRIRFGLKKERKIKRIIYLLNQGKYKYSLSVDNRGVTNICLNTESSKRILSLINNIKKYPSDFIYLNNHQAQIFIDELIQVDGDYESYKKHGTYRINSKNEDEIDFLQSIFCINGGLCQKRDRISNSGFIKNAHMFYVTRISPEKLKYSKSGTHNSKIIKTKEKHYVGNVYCISCSTSFFIARQHGTTFITGNCHAGKGCVIGFTADLGDKVISNITGVDIGCGMRVVKLKDTDIDLKELDKMIGQYIPSGHNIHNDAIKSFDYNKLYCINKLKNKDIINASIGSLGGGNHFIEVDKDSNGASYLIIHTGSRNLGKQVAEYYQSLAEERFSEKAQMSEVIKEKIKELKNSRQERLIESEVNKIKETFSAIPKVPKEFSYLEGKDREDYLHDMRLCQKYAELNRETIAEIILDRGNLHKDYEFESVHNYIGDDNIVRKGAISAYEGEKLLIPLNMRDGCIIGVGKGNPDWNYSGPHGAGRVMSRSKAKENISLDDFKKSMEGIYTTSVDASTIDESPFAYKNAEEIISNIEDTVEIQDIMKPVYNFKASELANRELIEEKEDDYELE